MDRLKVLVALSFLLVPACATDAGVDEESCSGAKCDDSNPQEAEQGCGPIVDTTGVDVVITLAMNSNDRVAKQTTRHVGEDSYEESVYSYDDRFSLYAEEYTWYSASNEPIARLNMELDIDDDGYLRSIDNIASFSGRHTRQSYEYVNGKLSSVASDCLSCSDDFPENKRFQVLYASLDQDTHEMTVAEEGGDEETVYRYDAGHDAPWSTGVRIADTLLVSDMVPHSHDRMLTITKTEFSDKIESLSYEYNENGYVIGGVTPTRWSSSASFAVTYTCADAGDASQSK